MIELDEFRFHRELEEKLEILVADYGIDFFKMPDLIQGSIRKYDSGYEVLIPIDGSRSVESAIILYSLVFNEEEKRVSFFLLRRSEGMLRKIVWEDLYPKEKSFYQANLLQRIDEWHERIGKKRK